MEARFPSPDFMQRISQPVVHLVYTSCLKTAALSKLQFYLHIFYTGYRRVHGQGFPFTGLGVVICKDLKNLLERLGCSMLCAQGTLRDSARRPGHSEQS